MAENKKERLEFRGGMFMSLIPVAIFFAFCIILFVWFKAFNMEALATGGFIALLIGAAFCKSYTKFWNAAISGARSDMALSIAAAFIFAALASSSSRRRMNALRPPVTGG